MKHKGSRATAVGDDLPFSYVLYLLGALILMVIVAGILIYFVVL